MLPEEAIKEFKILYKKVFGIELTDSEAIFRANNLLRLYKVIYKASPANMVKGTQNGQV